MKQLFVLALICLMFALSCDPVLSKNPVGNDTGSGSLIINEVALPYYTNYSIGIEIYNKGDGPANLSQYTVRSNSRTAESGFPSNGIMTFSLPALSIPAKGYALIRGRANSDYVSGGPVVYLDDGLNHYHWASHSGGFVELRDLSGTTVDFIRWGSDSTTPATGSCTGSLAAVTSDISHIGYSWARDSLSTDSDDSSDWTLRAWNTMGGQNDVVSDADSDGDGIPDCSEAPGSTFAGLPLYAWGARSGKKDIFIHVDYMDSSQDSGYVSADAMLTPKKEALDRVRDAFLAQDIVVHFDAGNLFSPTQGDAANYNLDGRSHKVDWVKSITLGVDSGYGNVYEYKVKYMPVAKRQVFFYMLFGSSQEPDGTAGSSGLASLNGNTSLISFGRWNVTNVQCIVNYQASTIMHEFGHNLGLFHGGNESVNYKPNYFSIMNYMYQLNGLPTLATANTRYYREYANRIGGLNAAWTTTANSANWVDNSYTSSFKFDYSDGSSSSLDESGLGEAGGVGRAESCAIDFSNDGDAIDAGVSF